MKFKILCTLLMFIFFFSCKKDSSSSQKVEEDINASAQDMSDLNVADGFDYSVTTDVNFNITTIDSTGQAVKNVHTAIMGFSKGENQGILYSGISDENGKIQVELAVPNHHSDIIIQTNKAGNLRAFDFNLSPSISAQLQIDDPNLSAVDDRGLNCFPEITGIFSEDNKLIGISSSTPITSIELTFVDDTKETIGNSSEEVFMTNLTREICDDGIDNDGDGLVDCADPQCGQETGLCDGSLPCISSFYQIVGKSLMQLNPTTGEYTLVGDLPNAFDTYNGSGFNSEDGYIYCTGKINSTGKVYMVRMYANANVTLLGEMVGFEGRSYTGDMDDAGNWTNFYYKDGTWHMAQVDVDAPTINFVTTQGVDNGAGNKNHHDWVYNAVCDKFYTMEAGGQSILVADHKASPPTVSVLQTYSGLDGGAYGAAWSDDSGDLYFSNNGSGKIYKVDMDNSCSPTSINVVINGAATGNNDGMSCPYSPTIDFGATDTDGDGLTDDAELLSGTNPTDGCEPLFDSPTCDGVLNYSFVGKGLTDKEIAFVKVSTNCDAPPELLVILNDDIDNDIDNDGVANDSDPDPADPNKTFVQYAPSQNSYGTYAFEDLWPEQGDYDFNDFVVQVKEHVITNSSNKIYEIIYHIKIMAMGGLFNNSFGITIPDPNDNASSNIYSIHNTTFETFQRDGKEVIILKHPKALFYSNDLINADNSDPYFTPVEMEIRVNMNGDLTYPGDYGATFFIEQHGISGHEIHLPSVQPTSNMNTDLFGTIHDDTDPNSNKYYLTPTNLPWGLYVPTEWDYPLEGEEILDAYTEFDDYAQSNPSLPWYQNNGGNVNSSKIFTGH